MRKSQKKFCGRLFRDNFRDTRLLPTGWIVGESFLKLSYIKKLTILSMAVVCIAIACSKHIHKPIQTDEKFDSAFAANRYRLHEIIVMYKRTPTPAEVNTQKEDLAARGVGPVTV